MVAFTGEVRNLKKVNRIYALFLFLNRIGKEGCSMLKTDLTVETIGEPDIMALTESESTLFIDTILSCIVDFYTESRSQHDAK